MGRPRYENDPKLCKLVQCCINKRWSYTESKDFLKQNGYTLSEKQFQRIKKRIADLNKIKINELSQTAHSQFILNSLERLCSMKKQLYEHSKNTDNFWEMKAGFEAILKMDNQISRIYDSSDIVGNITFEN